MTSVITNVSALVALQSLQQVQFDLNQSQNRIATGLRINNPVDDAANFGIAQGLRSNLQALAADSQSLCDRTGLVSVPAAGASSARQLLPRDRTAPASAIKPSQTREQQHQP